MADSNRIGEACWYKHQYDSEWRSGILHAWSTDGDEDGSNPVGVVEDNEHLTCHSIYVAYICFAATPPD